MRPRGATSSRRFCIDLFAGAGGLSLGLGQADFVVSLAVGESDMAAETYYRNLLDPRDRNGEAWERHLRAGTGRSRLEAQIAGGLAVAPTAAVLECKDAVRARLAAVQARHGVSSVQIDLIAGG